MISAPQQPLQTTPPQPVKTDTPSVKTHGHLALLEWDDAPLRFAPAPSRLSAQPAPLQPFGPIKRSLADRCYDGGTAALLAVTIAALAATLSRF